MPHRNPLSLSDMPKFLFFPHASPLGDTKFGLMPTLQTGNSDRDLRRKQYKNQISEGFEVTKEAMKESVYNFYIWREEQGRVFISKIQREL